MKKKIHFIFLINEEILKNNHFQILILMLFSMLNFLCVEHSFQSNKSLFFYFFLFDFKLVFLTIKDFEFIWDLTEMTRAFVFAVKENKN
jgi:hypothetical protein